ncbi:MAG: hybrid sensor histidine kinase/response regulator [Myxococcales bacterium]|nr:hybrid sensor histidine kinase/response regulator [Myxococcales bacterium]
MGSASSERARVSDPVWYQFLDETRAHAASLSAAAALAALSTAEQHRLVGAMFALRTSAALLGVEAIARAATAAEIAVAEQSAQTWLDLRAPLLACARAIAEAVELLARPDSSGARLDDTSALDAAAEALGLRRVVSPAAPAASSSPAPPPSSDDTVWVPQVDADMIEPFLEEAAERIEALSQKLLRLESAPTAELVREIFRDLHTVKGSSAFVGLKRMQLLAHAAEDLVGQLRDGARAADRGVIDALLGALDGLRAILQAAAQVDPAAGARIDVPIDHVVARLRVPGLPAATGSPASATAATPTAPSEARQTVRVDFDKLDTLLNLVGELVLARARLHGTIASVAVLGRELDALVRRARLQRGRLDLDDVDRFQRILVELAADLGGGAGALDHVSADLRQQVMKLRMLPVARVFTKYHRTVRELANTLGKRVTLELIGAETELDKVLLEQLDDPLMHLVRNCVDHGIESPATRRAAGKPDEGTITLSARHRGNQIVVEVSDDGAGIDPARLRAKAREKQLCSDEELAAMDDALLLELIFRPGFSTAARVTDVSGRGVGMDVVRDTLQRLSGTIELSSRPGSGTTFTLKLPLTLAIVQVLLVRIGGEDYALPLDVVQRTLAVTPADVHRVHDREIIFVGDEQVPLVWAAEALELGAGGPRVDFGGGGGDWPVVLVDAGGQTYALAVERLVGKREIVLKSLGALLEQVPCAAGATLIGDRVAVILDVVQVVQRGAAGRGKKAVSSQLSAISTAQTRRARILLAEDSDVVREQLRRVLEAHGYEVVTARDGAEALEIASRDTAGFDLVSTDVMMPNLDGYELTRALRAQPRHREVPMIMVTSKGEHLDRVRGFDAGVDDYLTKPLDAGELIRAVERHLGAARTRPS